MDLGRCHCLCHRKGSILAWHKPLIEDPVESLVACDLCAPIHAGVWTVVPRGYDPHTDNGWSGQGDGSE